MMGHVASMIIRESAGESQCGQTEESSSVAECGNSVVAILCATNSEFLHDAKNCRALYRKTNLCFCAIPSQDYGMKFLRLRRVGGVPSPSSAHRMLCTCPRRCPSNDRLRLGGLKAMWAPAAQIRLHSRVVLGGSSAGDGLSASTCWTGDD